MTDPRPKPQVALSPVLRSLMIMHWTRMGSLNALENAAPGGYWRKWIGGPIPKADIAGRITARFDLDEFRDLLQEHYRRCKRNKSLKPLPGGFFLLVLDGHEMGATYRRCWPGALQRAVTAKTGERIQYYLRHVAAMLVHAEGQLMLDIEPQQPGEWEIAAALRLYQRVHRNYPRAFNLVAGDSLYMDPNLCRLIDHHGNYFIVVLKNENRDLVVDARSLFKEVPCREWDVDGVHIQGWDVEGLGTWPQFGKPIRVVRTVECQTVRRQLTGESENTRVEWMWATTLPKKLAPTSRTVQFGHGRWTIENQGFNELVNQWHANHIYKHDPIAIGVFYLMLFLAYNLFHAMYRRNLKAAVRQRHTMEFFVEQVSAEFHSKLDPARTGCPPRGRPP